MTTKTILGVVFIVFIGVLGLAYYSTRPSPESPAPASSTQSPTAQQNTDGYTMAEVAKHNSASSCWTAVNGNAYDVTKWIDQHPGGRQAILSLCGTDGSSAFNDQHGGQRRPAQELAGFLLGPLQ